MQKIISLFKRDYGGNRQVINEVVPGAEWVVSGKGEATVKLDGSCCLIRDGKLYKRYTVKRDKKAPEGFEPATDVDPMTGKQEGWVSIDDGPEDRWHREAFESGFDSYDHGFVDGQTYELCGPKINGNPECLGRHVLIPHGKEVIVNCPREWTSLRDFFSMTNIEGIVWHHSDGRMVKIKGKDFGIGRLDFLTTKPSREANWNTPTNPRQDVEDATRRALENVGYDDQAARKQMANHLRTLADQIENSDETFSRSEYVHIKPIMVDNVMRDAMYIGTSIIIHHNADDHMLLERLQQKIIRTPLVTETLRQSDGKPLPIK